nr:[FeFe] hydrogenase H-cluster maturation GTPase HydF [Maliibacterium massiliense]
MGQNDTPSANRVHIGFFGRRNAGKSSVVNAVTGQNLAVVSDIKGTTTDPVQKAMELLPVGPVLIIDTPGYDDTGALGALRVQRTRQVLEKTDVAVLVTDASQGLDACERELIGLFAQRDIPYIIACNKADLLAGAPQDRDDALYVSAKSGAGIAALKERIAALALQKEPKRRIVGDLVNAGDIVVLVTPIDEAAPKGRIILPQQQTIRDLLDADATAVVVKETGLGGALLALGRKPALVITDSQAFAQVARDTPEDIPLTSFSILMARYKGLLDAAVRGVAAVNRLRDGDTVLIAEGCTHHRQCNDIGTVKIPRWLHGYTGKRLQIVSVSGAEFPEDLSPYALVIHCGGCMLNERAVHYRMRCAAAQGVPITNYGITIAYMQGILRRSLGVFPHLAAALAGD